ncbi:hypothetical protein SAMD00019534_040340 [Acytostelium subglobosum LB1]|uniref:hypothetical protein n=1 Tax=Acytostelium subglobosum LB1 TaxID=1410327 RepID=UPI000644E2C2|nr:hypothetical protein SAMD00019534_040340 [Acytostelium subglobosum LB1]GAM20859.1 hypothetical protein SAMD00019534_040340 [Acytostelium subglobosum LB1]|eukprot:XP_012755993.1 hypothetical protein SAMD00019534_040340 [Acytostelium subglobosum LB1]
MVNQESGVGAAVCNYISARSLDDVKYMLEHIGNVKANPVLCEWAALSDHIEVFEHVISLFTLDQLEDDAVDCIITQTLTRDRNHLGFLQAFLKHYGLSSTILRPTTETLHNMVIYNSHHTLDYYFNTPSFTNMSQSERLSIIHSIKDKGYEYGTTRVIKLCNDQINAISYS